ncbi:MAG TPA: hypothetical protein PKA60_01135 [Candidatus Paceibacterota bacterium]|nr:hypothetical protein [Candidatus Paceibacterota bacterium]
MSEEKDQQNNTENFVIKPLRTYEGDVANFIKKGQITTAKIVVEEQKRNQKKELLQKEIVETKKTNLAMVASISLLIIGIIIAGGAFWFTKINNSNLINGISVSQFRDILLDKKSKIEIFTENKSNSDLKNEIINKIKARPKLALGEIVEIQILDKVVIQNDGKITESYEKSSIENIFGFLGFTLTAPTIRAFDENYLIGLIGANDDSHPFILIKTREYSNVFAGMLEWEKIMYRQVNDIFFQTLSTDDFPAELPNFVDIVIFNRDARAILNDANQPQFYYTFVNSDHLLISSKPEIVGEISKKLNLQNIVR